MTQLSLYRSGREGVGVLLPALVFYLAAANDGTCTADLSTHIQIRSCAHCEKYPRSDLARSPNRSCKPVSAEG